jgi:hypothetical protein
LNIFWKKYCVALLLVKYIKYFLEKVVLLYFWLSILNIFWKKYCFALLWVDMDTNPETVPDPDRQALDSTTAKCIQIHNTPYHMPIMLSSYVSHTDNAQGLPILSRKEVQPIELFFFELPTPTAGNN